MPKTVPHGPTRDLLAQNIKRLLIEKDIKINTLAKTAGVSRSVIYLILDSNQAVSIDVIARIADALACHVSELFRPT